LNGNKIRLGIVAALPRDDHEGVGLFLSDSPKVRLAGRRRATTIRNRGRNGERQRMAGVTKDTVGSGLRTLFETGTIVGRSDVELLDRFLAAGGPAAELAFATLVEWHGPMVWRVCRDVLRESNDADDAFQATFLILARRAGAIRKRSSLGPWLYGVALRVARTARRRAIRRRDREQRAAEPQREETMADVDRLDAAPILHEEVGRLPEKYRAPLVLCYFQGLTHDQAAGQLGWPVGTVRSRLAVARGRLRPQLMRRGVAPSVAILAATGRAEALTAVPAALVSATVGMAVRAGAAGSVPAAVSALVGTTLREMTIMKTSMIATGLVAVALFGTAGVGYVTARPQDAEKSVTPKQDDPIPKAGAVPIAIERGRNRDNPPVSNVRLGMNSSRVLWARLNAAASNIRVAVELHAQARGQYDAVVAAHGEFEALAAELNTCVDDLRDEVDLLEAQLKIRKADVQASKAQQAKALESLTNVQTLANRQGVSQQEVRLYQSDLDLRSAELAKKQAEEDEIALRIKQATRRRDEAIALAKRAEGLVPDPEVPKGPSAPAAKR
jgi:RNA polymerase sigma factor (sigma-70 family)